MKTTHNDNNSDGVKCICCKKLFNITHFISETNGKQTKKCKLCRTQSKQSIQTVAEQYKKLKLTLPPCEMCGDDNPDHKEFDHIDPEKKTCKVGWCRTLEKLEEEYKKCRCLCMKCHRKHSYNQSQKNINTHGKLVVKRNRVKRNCPCLC